MAELILTLLCFEAWQDICYIYTVRVAVLLGIYICTDSCLHMSNVWETASQMLQICLILFALEWCITNSLKMSLPRYTHQLQLVLKCRSGWSVSSAFSKQHQGSFFTWGQYPNRPRRKRTRQEKGKSHTRGIFWDLCIISICIWYFYRLILKKQQGSLKADAN